MLRLLQKAGADSSQKTSLGRSALQLVDQQTEQFEHISALVENTTDIWRCPESWGTPESSFYILLLDHFSIETHGDLGITHFKKPPFLFGWDRVWRWFLMVVEQMSMNDNEWQWLV